MKTFQVIHCAETIKGGIATYLRELLPLQLAALGAGTIALVIPDSQAIELILPEGIVLITFPDKRGRLGNSLSLALTINKILREYSATNIHVHSTFAGASVRPLVKLLHRKINIVYCPHGWAWDRPMAKWKKTLTENVERFLSLFCHCIVCISQHEKIQAELAKISSRKLTVVLNGLSDTPLPNDKTTYIWPKNKRKLLFVGRLDHQKGVDIFCDAMRSLEHEASAILVGDYVLGDSAFLEFPSNIVHVGWLRPNELLKLYSAADILVVPSRWEGFGLVAIEAMRSGLPVIASRVGGLSEVVQNNKTGLLIPPSNPQELVDAIRNLDYQTLLNMGKEGRLVFEQSFSIDRTHRQIMELYRSP